MYVEWIWKNVAKSPDLRANAKPRPQGGTEPTPEPVPVFTNPSILQSCGNCIWSLLGWLGWAGLAPGEERWGNAWPGSHRQHGPGQVRPREMWSCALVRPRSWLGTRQHHVQAGGDCWWRAWSIQSWLPELPLHRDLWCSGSTGKYHLHCIAAGVSHWITAPGTVHIHHTMYYLPSHTAGYLVVMGGCHCVTCHMSLVWVTTGASTTSTTVHCGPRPTELGAVLACAGCCPRTGLPGLGWWWYLLVRAAGGLAQCSGPYWPQGDIGILLLSSEKRRHGT